MMSKRIKYTDAVPNSIVTRYKEDNTQYLLDQVARLTAENAMLKEKWLAPPKREPFEPEERQRLSKAYSTRAEQVAFEEGIIFAEISYGIGGM